uniref:Bm5398, isoform c n=4 Tax=Brugia malayi TaxID=6279 RepID=A0A1I9G3U8_BRUMA|nr:Bm5398, isoform c [Brugia malayi]
MSKMNESENSRIQMDFLEVCSFGDLEQAKAMLENGKIDRSFQHHGNGWTALHWAARRNHQEIVGLLLRAGFDPETPAKDGKTPLDLVTSEAVKEIFKQSVNIKTNQKDTHTVLVSHEMNSNGKFSSLHDTRFLLVRTSIADGKECFKRVALPGCVSINALKLTIERAMKKGEVLEVITLPDKVKIETEEQIRDLTNHQKVEVLFNSAVMNEEKNCVQKLSPHEDKVVHSECAPKFVSVINKYLNESASYGRSVDNIISLSDTGNSNDVDNSFSGMKGSDPISNEQMMNMKISEVAVTSECFLTNHSFSSNTNITIPPKILVEEMIQLQMISSRQSDDEIDLDKSVQISKSETKNDCKLAESGSEIGTESSVLSLSPEVDVNNSTVCYITESNCFAAVQEEWDKIIVQDLSRKRTLQITLVIGCIVGFGGLTYILYKKWKS